MNRLPKAFYFWSYLFANVIWFLLNISFEPNKEATEWTSLVSTISGLFFIYGVIVTSIFTYKIWKIIPVSYARTTPGKAVGFGFIPIYNLYWVFQATYGWTKDFNTTVRNLNKNWHTVSETLGFIVSIVSMIVWVINAFVGLITPLAGIPFKFTYILTYILSFVGLAIFAVFIYKVCDVINAINPGDIYKTRRFK